ncbi:CLUMA_CG011670, isoform A [Clunio marinus]|uniref:CLUMA_CG011670, isoform A n=1 Tax=Clunio marinus TaxID=568069 RepID=A0A1J1IFI3_9DIPT|nr:CLUMA_CG011670, isoform A [Clunio marinus]
MEDCLIFRSNRVAASQPIIIVISTIYENRSCLLLRSYLMETKNTLRYIRVRADSRKKRTRLFNT